MTGLSGSGLTLGLGIATVAVSANGAFTYPGTFAAGTLAYSASVNAQPTNPSQTCTVANGTGTVGAANVTNIAVTCTTNTYTISGMANGLSGSGLTLRNNGAGPALAVPLTGAFTFPAPVVSNGAYAVTIVTQPVNPAQTCTLANASGTVAAADIANITITCTTTTYTVGGMVSGLAGSGLTLRNNGGGDLIVAANGAFTFAAPVTNGGVYGVTIAAQPSNPTQTCVLANASGIASANITNVTVTCTTNGFSVGGTVSGLLGSGLELQINGARDLLVSVNGAFAFTNAIIPGQAYTVTVKTQPSSPAQTCVLFNPSGTMASAAVTNVNLTCTSAGSRFAYVSGITGIYCYAIDAISHALVPLPTPLCDAGSLTGVAVDPSGTYAYSTDSANGQIVPYTINQSTGALTRISGAAIAAGTNPIALVVHTSGNFVYAINQGSDTVSAYRITAGSGALTAIGSPVATGSSPNSIVMDRSGASLYIANTTSANLTALSINPTTGALTAVAGSPFAVSTIPNSVTVSPQNSHVLVTSFGTDRVHVYARNSVGVLTQVAGSPFVTGTHPTGVGFDNFGAYAYVADQSANDISAYLFNATTGALSAVAGSPFARAGAPTNITAHPGDRFIYVSNLGAGTVSTFSYTQATGALTELGSPVFASGVGAGANIIAIAP